MSVFGNYAEWGVLRALGLENVVTLLSYRPASGYLFYFGIGGLFFVAWVVARRQRGIARFLVGILVGALLWAMAGRIYGLVASQLPFVRYMESPERMVAIAYIAAAILTAIGLEDFTASVQRSNNVRRLAGWLAVALLVAAASAWVLFVALGAVPSMLGGQLDSAASRHYSVANLGAVVILALAAVLVVTILLFVRRRIDVVAFSNAAVAIMIVDLVSLALVTRDFGDPASLSSPPPGIEWLRQTLREHAERGWRVVGLASEDIKSPDAAARVRWSDLAEPNLLSRFEVVDLRGFDSVYPKVTHDYASALRNLPFDGNWQAIVLRIGEVDRQLLDVASVRYIVVPPQRQAGIQDTSLVYSGDDMWIYENKSALPRAYVAESWTQVSATEAGRQQTFELMRSPEFAGSHQAILNGDVCANRANSVSALPGEAVLVKETFNSAVIRVSVEQPSVIMVSTTYDPGWRATINGKPIPVRRGNWAFSALCAPAGSYEIIQTYWPQSFPLGLGVSVAGGLLMVAMFLVALLDGRRWKETVDSRGGDTW